MLFEAHVVQIVPTRNSHPFYKQNNINDTDYLENVEDVFTLRYPELTRLAGAIYPGSRRQRQ